jgi:hypothetical protein
MEGAPAWVERDEEREQESSFSEEKEAKRLFTLCARCPFWHACKVGKVFWFFFSKKNALSCLSALPHHAAA